MSVEDVNGVFMSLSINRGDALHNNISIWNNSTLASTTTTLTTLKSKSAETETILATEIVDDALTSALNYVTGQTTDTLTQTQPLSLRISESEMETIIMNNNNNNNNLSTETTGLLTAPEHLKSAINTRGRKISVDGRKRSVTFDPKFIKDNSIETVETTTESQQSEHISPQPPAQHHHPYIQHPPTNSSFKEDEESDPESETTRL